MSIYSEGYISLNTVNKATLGLHRVNNVHTRFRSWSVIDDMQTHFPLILDLLYLFAAMATMSIVHLSILQVQIYLYRESPRLKVSI